MALEGARELYSRGYSIDQIAALYDWLAATGYSARVSSSGKISAFRRGYAINPITIKPGFVRSGIATTRREWGSLELESPGYEHPGAQGVFYLPFMREAAPITFNPLTGVGKTFQTYGQASKQTGFLLTPISQAQARKYDVKRLFYSGSAPPFLQLEPPVPVKPATVSEPPATSLFQPPQPPQPPQQRVSIGRIVKQKLFSSFIGFRPRK